MYRTRALLLALLATTILACETPTVVTADEEGQPDTGETFSEACFRCHGNSLSPAPPRAIYGESSDPSFVGVGAHRTHLGDKSTWRTPVPCSSCHLVPEEINSPGHIDDNDEQAEINFGGLATAGGMEPTWDRVTETCSNVYCHGATMASQTIPAPQWTKVDGTQNVCGTCHGNPPPAPHSQSTDCGSCHPTMQPGTNRFRDPESHIDGKLDIGEGGSCDSCHGSDGISAPPRDLAGNTSRASQGIGAHRVHLALSNWRREISCSNCHVSPVDVGDPGHMDGDNIAEVPFDSFNPTATFNRGAGTCNNLYCHGNGRGSNGSETWTSTTAMTCTSCHSMSGNGLGGEHGEHLNGEDNTQNIDCVTCHSDVVDGGRNVINANLHVDGRKSVRMDQGTYANGRCTNLACHGNENW